MEAWDDLPVKAGSVSVSSESVDDSDAGVLPGSGAQLLVLPKAGPIKSKAGAGVGAGAGTEDAVAASAPNVLLCDDGTFQRVSALFAAQNVRQLAGSGVLGGVLEIVAAHEAELREMADYP